MDASGTYTGLVEVATEALFALDPEGVVLAWNPGAERLYGVTAEQAVGRVVTDLVVPVEGRRPFAEWLAELQRGPLQVLTTRPTQQGDRRHVSISMKWIPTDS